MATGYIDHISDLSMTEKLGVIRSLTRKARVLIDMSENPHDYSVLSVAMDICPAVFSQLLDPNTGQPRTGYESLVLVERSPKLIEDNATVDVTLKYDHVMDGPNQVLFAPTQRSGVLFTRGKYSITQKSTNFYRKDGDPTAERVQILVSHTFPMYDTGAIVQCLNPDLPNTAVQSGEINVPFPQSNIQLQGVLQDSNGINPHTIARRFGAKINKTEWIGYPPQTWLCSEVGWEVLDTTGTTYRFNFEFQYNFDTWNPTVVFNDQRTGRPPAGVEPADTPDPLALNGVISYRQVVLIEGAPLPIGFVPPGEFFIAPAGYWTVPALEQVNFDELFQATFEGFQMPVMG